MIKNHAHHPHLQLDWRVVSHWLSVAPHIPADLLKSILTDFEYANTDFAWGEHSCLEDSKNKLLVNKEDKNHHLISVGSHNNNKVKIRPEDSPK